jgi:hypothetical protein
VTFCTVAPLFSFLSRWNHHCCHVSRPLPGGPTLLLLAAAIR